MALESMIEKVAREHMLKRGGVCLKFVSPGMAGVPDRLLSHPACGPFFMEFKSPGKRMSALQRAVAADLTARGMRVYADVDSITMARQIIDDEVTNMAPMLSRYRPVGP